MKKRSSILLTLFTVIVTVSMVTISCNKKFDAPPLNGGGDPTNIAATKTIAGFKAAYLTTSTVLPITDSTVIAGVISANDQSGNIYKEIFIQDSTGGISIKMNGTNLYASYPVGMRVFIKCYGLAISDYNGDMELGAIDNTNPAPAITGIPGSLFSQYIITGSLDNKVAAKTVTIAELNSAAALAPRLDTLQNTLVTISNAEFVSSALGLIYSDTSTSKGNVIRYLEDCSSGTATTELYTSGYANFAGATLPAGNGSFTAIYVPFRSSSELYLRDTTDVKLTGTRCNGSSGTPAAARISIAQLRAMYTGSSVSIGDHSIGGVVISDAANGNITKGSVVLQDGNAGISVYFGGTLTYQLGDSVIINLTPNDSLTNYKGSLEVSTAYGTTAPAATSHGHAIVPKVITVAALNSALASALGSPSNIEYTLVQISNATVSPAGPYYAANVFPDLTDASAAKIELFTNKAATFGSAAMPTTCQNWIGYANTFSSSTELQIRNTNDVTPGTGCAAPPPSNATGIAAIRALYNGSNVTLSSTTVTGVVISDAADKNISSGSVVIQNGNAGISVYFGGTVTYNIGDSLVISIPAGSVLESYNGSLEISTPKGTAAPAAVATGKVIAPKVMTIAQLNAALGNALNSPNNIEYTLVTIENATVSPAGNYYTKSVYPNLNDGTGNIELYTTSAATFGSQTMPTTAKSWTGFANVYSTGTEFMIRNTSDVQ